MKIEHAIEKRFINIYYEEQKIQEMYYKSIVTLAGGEYVGIQKSNAEDLVLFNDAIGSTKAVKISDINVENIQKKLNENTIL